MRGKLSRPLRPGRARRPSCPVRPTRSRGCSATSPSLARKPPSSARPVRGGSLRPLRPGRARRPSCPVRPTRSRGCSATSPSLARKPPSSARPVRGGSLRPLRSGRARRPSCPVRSTGPRGCSATSPSLARKPPSSARPVRGGSLRPLRSGRARRPSCPVRSTGPRGCSANSPIGPPGMAREKFLRRSLQIRFEAGLLCLLREAVRCGNGAVPFPSGSRGRSRPWPIGGLTSPTNQPTQPDPPVEGQPWCARQPETCGRQPNAQRGSTGLRGQRRPAATPASRI